MPNDALKSQPAAPEQDAELAGDKEIEYILRVLDAAEEFGPEYLRVSTASPISAENTVKLGHAYRGQSAEIARLRAALNGMIGLIGLITERDDISQALKDAIVRSHRLTEAHSALSPPAKPEGGNHA